LIEAKPGSLPQHEMLANVGSGSNRVGFAPRQSPGLPRTTDIIKTARLVRFVPKQTFLLAERDGRIDVSLCDANDGALYRLINPMDRNQRR